VINVQVSREIDYYAKQSRTMTTLITVLGGLVAGVMERSREIATMRSRLWRAFGCRLVPDRSAIRFLLSAASSDVLQSCR
jgi:hypothetical protein